MPLTTFGKLKPKSQWTIFHEIISVNRKRFLITLPATFDRFIEIKFNQDATQFKSRNQELSYANYCMKHYNPENPNRKSVTMMHKQDRNRNFSEMCAFYKENIMLLNLIKENELSLFDIEHNFNHIEFSYVDSVEQVSSLRRDTQDVTTT